MALPTSRYIKAEVFHGSFWGSWVTLGPAAMNVLLFVGLAAMMVKRWQAFDAYLLTLAFGLVVGTVFLWIKVWKEFVEIRAVVTESSPQAAPSPSERILRSAAALIHLAAFYWVMAAFFAAMAIDWATR